MCCGSHRWGVLYHIANKSDADETSFNAFTVSGLFSLLSLVFVATWASSVEWPLATLLVGFSVVTTLVVGYSFFNEYSGSERWQVLPMYAASIFVPVAVLLDVLSVGQLFVQVFMGAVLVGVFVLTLWGSPTERVP